MADISKIKLANGTTVDLKDAAGRANLTNLINSLGTAAYEDIASDINDRDGLPNAGTVKAYVDAQVGAINKFDVQIYTTLPTAAANTMYIIGLVANTDAEAGNYVEYITVRTGSEGNYSYAWEKIGSTKTDLTGYVPNTRTVAGIDLADDITAAEVKTALGLKALAYAATASGSDTIDTIDSIEMKDLTVAGNATVTSTDATAVLAKGDYTPTGSITGDAIKGGSINVTLKDAATASDATIATTSTYTPAGTVAAVEGGDFEAITSATFTADANGTQITGSVSAPAINLTSNEANVAVGLTGGKVASIDTTKFSGGSFTGATQASFTQGAKASFTQGAKASFTKGTAVNAATEGIVASVGTGADAETLIFTNAAKDEVIDYQAATFTANGDDTFVANGDDDFTANGLGTFTPAAIADGFFSANELQSASMGIVNNVTAAALASNPVFTGGKFKVATTADTALKEVAFTASNNVSVPTKITYKKQEVDAKTFTPVVATLGFSGTTAEDILVTGVTYKKADATAAFSETVKPEVETLNKTAKSVEITVTPDA